MCCKDKEFLYNFNTQVATVNVADGLLITQENEEYNPPSDDILQAIEDLQKLISGGGGTGGTNNYVDLENEYFDHQTFVKGSLLRLAWPDGISEESDNHFAKTLSEEVSKRINGEELFTLSYEISKKFKLGFKDNKIHIMLDIVNLDKHFLLYLIELLTKLLDKFKEENL